MMYAILVLVALVLMLSFIALVQYETARGVRVYESLRARIDKQVFRLEFIASHVDFGAFVRSELSVVLHYIGHYIARTILGGVRAVERLLTRIVLHIRQKTATEEKPREHVRDFVRMLTNFKGTLSKKHREVIGSEVVERNRPA